MQKYKIKMYKNILLLISVIFLNLTVISQNLESTKEIVEILSSPQYEGRGYVNNGVNKAADFIKNKIQNIGVKPFGKSYFQNLTFNINTFPSTVEVLLDSQALIPGIDFIVGNETPTTKNKYSLFIPDSITLNDYNALVEKLFWKDLKNTALVINYKYVNHDTILKKKYTTLLSTNEFKLGAIIEAVSGNLAWGVRTTQKNFPMIKISESSLPKDAKEITINIKSKYIKNFKTKNIAGYIEGKDKDKFIVLTAHYDHLGKMGKNVYIPGASDNASGTAMLIDIADYFSKNKPQYSVAFIWFTGEEAGLLGSFHYVKNPLFDLSKIKAVINIDIIGTGDKGMAVINGKTEGYEKIFNTFVEINNEGNLLEEIRPVHETKNSDHYPFSKEGILAVFVHTLGGNAYYHNVKDLPATLSWAGYNSIFTIITKFIERYE